MGCRLVLSPGNQRKCFIKNIDFVTGLASEFLHCKFFKCFYLCSEDVINLTSAINSLSEQKRKATVEMGKKATVPGDQSSKKMLKKPQMPVIIVTGK